MIQEERMGLKLEKLNKEQFAKSLKTPASSEEGGRKEAAERAKLQKKEDVDTWIKIQDQPLHRNLWTALQHCKLREVNFILSQDEYHIIYLLLLYSFLTML